MNKTLDELTDLYYEKFKGLPNNNPIVRINQKDDAFELVVLEILYGAEKKLDIGAMTKQDVNILASYIVQAPDDGVDFIIEHETIDGYFYDFVQVKNSVLHPADIKKEIRYMESSIDAYVSNPESLNDNLKSVLSETNFVREKEYKEKCKFILVHRGTANYFKDQKENYEQVITSTELDILRNCTNKDLPKVPKEILKSDSFSNFIEYTGSSDEPAIIFNICGYDLAELALKYTNTSLGRNILFGQNLRESLTKSGTYEGMKKTIEKEPERFWFYNNGITIIVENYDAILKEGDASTVDNIILERFSIINGAQTTSALGRFLREARLDNKVENEEKLKRVFVLARVLKVTDKDFASDIAIYNNTQNPITTRDMAANRPEQIDLEKKLIENNPPNIYMEIKRGVRPENSVTLLKHQRTTNEELAQLCFAGFMQDPFAGKNRKNTLFDIDHKQDTYLVNEFYHKIFNDNPNKGIGILFEKKKEEIDELLFVYYLFKESQKSFNKVLRERIKRAKENNDEKEIIENEKLKAICNICSFYCMDYYYSLKYAFTLKSDIKIYDYKKYYEDKTYQTELIEDFRNLFLMSTIETICELTVTYPNLNTWARDKKSTTSFNENVGKKIRLQLQLEKEYNSFVSKHQKTLEN